jgi:hypothetical protein
MNGDGVKRHRVSLATGAAAPHSARETCGKGGTKTQESLTRRGCAYHKLSALYLALHRVPTGQSCLSLTSSIYTPPASSISTCERVHDEKNEKELQIQLEL